MINYLMKILSALILGSLLAVSAKAQGIGVNIVVPAPVIQIDLGGCPPPLMIGSPVTYSYTYGPLDVYNYPSYVVVWQWTGAIWVHSIYSYQDFLGWYGHRFGQHFVWHGRPPFYGDRRGPDRHEDRGGHHG